jgi:hypothetical protein
MSARVDIVVGDQYALLNYGYNEIKVYRSGSESDGFEEVTVSGSRVLLDPLVSRYEYYDIFGTVDSWYKWSYLDTDLWVESSLSPSVRGLVSGTHTRGISKYPAEVELTSSQQDTVYRIREYLGDSKEISRDRISPDTSYDNVSDDGYTVTLDNPPGWPLSVSVDGTYYSTLSDPVVNGYQFITFSGTEIVTDSTVVDVWYEHFRFSDRQIITSFDIAELPAGVNTNMATTEMYELQTAIKLLESEYRNFLATSSSKIAIYEEISIDPSAGLKARKDDLDRLKKKLQDLVDSSIANNIWLTGVRVD